MKKQIEEVQNYFKSKILSIDFEIKEIGTHRMSIIIDGCYPFTLWIGNLEISNSLKICEHGNNFIFIEIEDGEAIQLNTRVLPLIVKYRNEILLDRKIKEVEELKKQINITPYSTGEGLEDIGHKVRDDEYRSRYSERERGAIENSLNAEEAQSQSN